VADIFIFDACYIFVHPADYDDALLGVGCCQHHAQLQAQNKGKLGA
jgi:hypothetical protein